MKPAERLQSISPEQHWVVADSALLQSIANQEPVHRGPRGRLLANLLRWGDPVRLSGAILFAAGLAELLRLLRRQKSTTGAADVPLRFFVGFGAGPEDPLFRRYCAEGAGPVARLNQVAVATFGRWQRVGFVAAFRALWTAYRVALRALSQLPEPFRGWRLDFMTNAAMRLGLYSYMRAWFDRLRMRHPRLEEVCFLSADTPAFAAIDAGVPTRYLQHGLIRHSLVLPGFQRVDALTRDEERHFRRRLPKAHLTLETYPDLGGDGLARGILIASIYGDRSEMERILPFLQWTQERGFPVWVRPHPCEDRLFWVDQAEERQIHIEDADPSFLTALQRLRPRLVVSWYSTALADALQCGIVPVTVNDAASPSVKDMVYPLLERALQWPRHWDEITRLLNDHADYRRTIGELRGR